MAEEAETQNPPEVISRGLLPIYKLAAGADSQSNALLYEDEFKQWYTPEAERPTLIAPPIDPRTLFRMAQTSNSLGQCIDAMVRNVHGTGFGIEDAQNLEEENVDDPETKKVKGFFQEVWPGMTFQQLRHQTGVDQETCGYCFWEMLRNKRGELVMIRRLDPKITRLVRLGDPMNSPVKVRRGDETITLNVPMRYRRYAQRIGTQLVYFKDYRCPFLINSRSGELLTDNPANRLKLMKDNELGTEVLYFRLKEDVDTPYGVPTWYPQTPSVLGSRKAEEHNLDYFNSGGVPPMMIFVQGGTLGPSMKQTLDDYFSSTPGAKQGAPVFEVQPTGGSLDGGDSKVDVKIERFGSERQNDSMFEAYDEKCEGRIRRAWRLPPIFVGRSDDYNLATAQASYAVAEAQVFKPARDDFDTTINSTILLELAPSGKLSLRSKGLPVQNTAEQLNAVAQAFAAGAIDVEQLLLQLNEITSLSMKLRPAALDEFNKQMKAKIEMAEATVSMMKNPPAPNNNERPGTSKGPKQLATSTKDKGLKQKKPQNVAKNAEFAANEMFEALNSGDMPSILRAAGGLIELQPNLPEFEEEA